MASTQSYEKLVCMIYKIVLSTCKEKMNVNPRKSLLKTSSKSLTTAAAKSTFHLSPTARKSSPTPAPRIMGSYWMLETLVLNVRAALAGLKYLRQANEINKERFNDLIDKIHGHEKYDEESAAEIERLSDKIVVLMDGDNVGAMRRLRDRFDAAKAKAKQEEQKLMNKVTGEREEIELTQKEAERQKTLVASSLLCNTSLSRPSLAGSL